MIAEAERQARAGQPFDFVAIVRGVADARTVSAHDILSPPPSITYRHSEFWQRTVEHFDFDPQAGWSWREVLVWSSDAARVARAREEAQTHDEWKAGAQQRLRFAGA